MNLSQIQNDEIVVVDANIILYALEHQSVQCEQLIRRCAMREISCIIPSVQFAEVMHRLMIREAQDNGWVTGGNPARQLSGKPDRIRLLNRYESGIKSMLGMGFVMEPVLQEDFLVATASQRQHGLMTNDALLVAVAGRLRVEAVASSDLAIVRAPGIVLYSPTDIKP